MSRLQSDITRPHLKRQFSKGCKGIPPYFGENKVGEMSSTCRSAGVTSTPKGQMRPGACGFLKQIFFGAHLFENSHMTYLYTYQCVSVKCSDILRIVTAFHHLYVLYVY